MRFYRLSPEQVERLPPELRAALHMLIPELSAVEDIRQLQVMSAAFSGGDSVSQLLESLFVKTEGRYDPSVFLRLWEQMSRT